MKLIVLLLFLVPGFLQASSYLVNVAGDSKASNIWGGMAGSCPAGYSICGDLRYVLNAINDMDNNNPNTYQLGSAGSYKIDFQLDSNQITLNNFLPIVNLWQKNNVTIDGNNNGNQIIIDGNKIYRGFFIHQGEFTLSNMTIQNMNHVGGAGAGGGMAAGAALFINSLASSNISNIAFANNSVTGGAGLSGVGQGGGGFLGSGGAGNSNNGGGGGGFAGNGGAYNGGGGGMIGNGGQGYNNHMAGGGGGGISQSGSNYIYKSSEGSYGGDGAGEGGGGGGGKGGGKGGHSVYGGGGGYGGGAGGISSKGNNGEAASGDNSGKGGGSADSVGGDCMACQAGGGGAGGFGGGGGGSGGYGGQGGMFGGGGASGSIPSGTQGTGGDFGGGGAYAAGGFGGGGGYNASGGFGGGGKTGGVGGGTGGNAAGGAGFGGAIFVRSGGSLTIGGGVTTSSNKVIGGNGKYVGAAAGSDIFVMNGSTLQFNPASSNDIITLNGSIADDSANSIPSGKSWTAGDSSGSSISKIGDGTLALFGNNSYAGGTNISAGTLAISSANNLGSGKVTISNATLDLSGASSRVKLSNNVYLSGDTFINVGSNSVSLSNNISGSGNLTINGSGELNTNLPNGINLTNNANYNLNGEDQTIGALNGSGNIGLASNNIIINSGNYSGSITGSGGLIKNSASSLTLSGNNSYTGATKVNGGIVSINGTFQSPITVDINAVLKGVGTINNNVVNTGTIEPGNSIGTLTITGNYTANYGSQTNIQIDPSGNCSKLDIAGSMTINKGAILQIDNSPGNYIPNIGNLSLITASGGVSGTFAQVTVTNPIVVMPKISYSNDNVSLTWQRIMLTQNLPSKYVTSDNMEVLNYLDNLPVNTLNTEQSAMIGQMVVTPSIVPNVVNAIASKLGTVAAHSFHKLPLLSTSGSDNANVESGFSAASLAQLINYYKGTNDFTISNHPILSYLKDDVYFTIQAFAETAQQGGANPYKEKLGGATLQLSHKLNNKLVYKGLKWRQYLALGLGYSKSSVNLESTNDRTTVNGFSLAPSYRTLYKDKSHNLDTKGGIYLGANWYNSARIINLSSTSVARGSYFGYQISPYLQSKYLYKLADNISLGPYIKLAYSILHENAYTEQGGGGANLSYKSHNSSIMNNEVGVRFLTSWKHDNLKHKAHTEIDLGYIYRPSWNTSNAQVALAGQENSYVVTDNLSNQRNQISFAINNYFKWDKKNNLSLNFKSNAASSYYSLQATVGLQTKF